MDSADVYGRVIKYRGVFDFPGLYRFIIKWIKDHDFDFYERRVWDYPPYEIYVLEGRKKVNFYVMLHIKTKIWLWEKEEVEVVKSGHVKHMTDARMKIEINGTVIFDYDGDFEGKASLKKMEAFLNWKILYHELVLKYIDYFDYFLFDYMTDIKKFLEMETASNAY